MHNSLAKKIFAVLSSGAMVLAFMPFAAQAAVHGVGTNVVSNGTVYFLDGTSKRPYTSAGAFTSYGFNSWSGVVAASAEDLALPTGAFVPPADGSLINDHGTVYLMTNGQRAGFTSAANFLGLGYSFSNVIPGDTSFMTSAPLINSTAMSHPAGTLVNQNGEVDLISNTGKQGIPSLAVFNSWGYSFKNVVPANSYDAAVPMSNGVMPTFVLGCLSPLNCTGTTPPPPPPSGNLSVTIASDNPAGNTIIAGQSAADLLHLQFNGSGAVTTLTLKRIGISSDSTLTNVYLFNGAQRLTDAASVTSGGMITFSNANGLFNVNGSMNVSVKSDIWSSASAGTTVGIQFTSGMSGSNSISGSATGNLFSVATVTNLATATFSNITPAGTPQVNPQNDLVVWQGTLNISGNNAILSRMALREIGSINYTDISGFRLFVDGTQVAATQSLDSNGYVTFALSSPATLQTGSRTIQVLANVTGGSSRTFSFQIYNAADLGLTDAVYNVGITFSGSTVTGVTTVSQGNVTVQKATTSPSGNITINGTDVALADFTATSFGEAVKINNLNFGFVYTSVNTRIATLTTDGSSGTYSLTIGGTAVTTPATGAGHEAIDAATLTSNINANVTTGALVTATANGAVITLVNKALGTVTVTDTSTTVAITVGSASVANAGAQLRNARIMINGQQYGSTVNLPAAGLATPYFTVNYTLQPNTPVTIELRADTYDNDGTGQLHSGDTLVVSMLQGTQNGQGQTSSQLVNVPIGNTAGNTLTVATGSMTLAKQGTYVNQTTQLPQTQYKISAFNLTGSSTEDINLNTFTAGFPTNSAFLNNVVLKVNGVAQPTKGTVSTSATWSLNTVLPKGQTIPVEIWADILSGASTNITPNLTVSGSGVSTGNAVSAGPVNGQTITFSSGTITGAIDASSPSSKLALGGTTGNLIGAFKLQTTIDHYILTDVTLTFSGTNAGTILGIVVLKDSAGNTIGTTSLNGTTATYTGLTFPVPANQSTVFDVFADFGTVGAFAGSSGANVAPTLTSFKATDSTGTQNLQTPGVTASPQYVYKAIPTLTAVTPSSTNLSTGTVVLSKFQVSSSGSTVGWKKIVFSVAGLLSGKTVGSNDTVAPTDGIYVQNAGAADDTKAFNGVKLYDESGTEVTSSSLTYANAAAPTITFVATNEQQVSGSHTYELRATELISPIANDSVQTSIAQPSGFAAPDTYPNVAGTGASFVWSDQSAGTHDVTSSTDWNNDYLVKNLPFTQTLTR